MIDAKTKLDKVAQVMQSYFPEGAVSLVADGASVAAWERDLYVILIETMTKRFRLYVTKRAIEDTDPAMVLLSRQDVGHRSATHASALLTSRGLYWEWFPS